MRGLFHIPPRHAFIDALARGLLDAHGGDPLAFADALVLLPNRRAVRALRDAFLRITDGRPLLLPRIRPIGDIDDDELAASAGPTLGEDATRIEDLPPAVTPQRREALLARLVLEEGPRLAGIEAAAFSPAQALRLARELAGLLDELQIAGVPLDALSGLVADDHADHWRGTLEFLGILRTRWPQELRRLGAIDPVDRRSRALRAQAAQWRAQPPAHAVIAAGSTGTQPATRELLAAIADLPLGCVVLPGLDLDLDEEGWAALDETHPQFALRELLAGLGRLRHEVAHFPSLREGAEKENARAALLSEAMRPAATTDRWIGGMTDADRALANVTRIDCPTEQAEAVAIALALRETLQSPGRTAALVTPDRGLARRVAAELQRWEVDIDDSAGVPLSETPPAALARLLVAMMAGGFAPVASLSVLQHPFVALGMAREVCRHRARLLDAGVLRGPKPESGLQSLRDLVARGEGGQRGTLEELLAALARACAPLSAVGEDEAHPVAAWLTAMTQALEALAATDREPGAATMWRGDAGEALAHMIATRRDDSDELPPLTLAQLPDLLDELLAGVVVRPRHGRHPRLAILGPLEARLQHADRVVLGGLNEGTWPAAVDTGPWLNRPMRRALGLPQPELRIGQAAHDFAQAFAADEVFLVRSNRVGGTPTVPARWLARLDARLGYDSQDKDAKPPAYVAAGLAYLDWAMDLDAAAGRATPVRPAYSPPVPARPRRLSASAIEQWRRDPYGLYARLILKLFPLDPLEQPYGAAERGTAIHDALEAFLLDWPDELPDDAEAKLIELGRKTLGPLLARPADRAFWWPRFERLAGWFCDFERQRRAEGWRPYVLEKRGERVVGPVTINAKADRIDRNGSAWEIIDYKTGRIPTRNEIEAVYAPQLAVEALIARAGGYGEKAGGDIGLGYWRTGGGDAQRAVAVKDPAAVIAETERVLGEMIDAFYRDGAAYVAIPQPAYAPTFNDYAHLERIDEWATRVEPEDEDAP
ncbi:MAG: double-strand break repair protein AddB [Alphaproteobacteria bacterium]|nr:double-strand break repair protein AddB [Alphaproteobacteria bacterium]MCW5741446.1 double-strand break repair protein AddB [Alphaproteobacteria bacterium]